MARLSWLLLGLLAISVAINLAQWQGYLSPTSSVASSPIGQILDTQSEQIKAPNQPPTKADSAFTSDQTRETRNNQLDLAQQLLADKAFIELGALLQSYLKDHPLDIDFLLIEAKFKVATGLLSDAIINYYDLLRRPLNDKQQDHVLSQIAGLSSNAIEQLSNSHSWDLLAQFIEPLIQVAPNNRQYILALAQAYAEQDHFQLMENVLASLPPDDPSAQALRQQTLSSPPPSQSTDPFLSPQDDPFARERQFSKIQLKQYGDQYVVQANLANRPIDLLIDTGASITAVSEAFYERLSKSYRPRFQGQFNINTAGGTVMASVYRFNVLSIGHLQVENIAVVVLPFDNLPNAQGLLGMNFLREFEFKIDQKNAQLLIE